MTKETIVLTIVSSLLSGILGVFISSWFYARLELRRIKMQTARMMFGNKHAISGAAFQEAMNEVLIVFSDSQEVIDAVQHISTVVETPLSARPQKAADEAMVKLMKVMCKDIGIKFKHLPDSYYLKFFEVPQSSA